MARPTSARHSLTNISGLGPSAGTFASPDGSDLEDNGENSDRESVRTGFNDQYDEGNSVFQDWLHRERAKCIPREPRGDVLSTILAAHSLELDVHFSEDALVHPWHNPLNRSRLEATTQSDYVDDCARLPRTGSSLRISTLFAMRS